MKKHVLLPLVAVMSILLVVFWIQGRNERDLRQSLEQAEINKTVNDLRRMAGLADFYKQKMHHYPGLPNRTMPVQAALVDPLQGIPFFESPPVDPAAPAKPFLYERGSVDGDDTFIILAPGRHDPRLLARLNDAWTRGDQLAYSSEDDDIVTVSAPDKK